jgi:pyruvate,water dikinase
VSSPRPAALQLDEVRPGDRGRVGVKAAALAALRQSGLPVPGGFVLAADAAERAGDVVREAYARLGGRVAVRSSSTAEDLAGASFAGQYATRLDVSGEHAVLDAVAECLGQTARAAAYAAALGAPDGRMAVLVQRFVEPRVAGVVFTRHPIDPSLLLVEAHAGRGEELVSGRVTPTAYEVERSSGAPREDVAGPLSLSELLQIVELALAAERLFGAPQDVEWALGEAGPALLQSRPISVASVAGLPRAARRLTRANIGEVLPGPVAPLTWTSVVAFLERGFLQVAREAGLVRGELAAPFLVHYRQRAYLNLSLCLEVGTRLPGVSAADAERLLFGQLPAVGPAAPARRAWRALPSLARIALRLAGLSRRLPREIEAVQRSLATWPGRERLAAADWDSLPGLWSAFLRAGDQVARVHVISSGACGLRLALLRAALRRVPGDPSDLANRLLSGLDDVASVRPTLELEALAAAWRGRIEVQAFVEEAGAPPEGLSVALGGFLEEFGHRALSEADLRAPSWEDEPTPLHEALRALLREERPAGFAHAARATARRADLESVLHRLGPLRAAVARRFLDAAADAVRERELTKSLAVRVVAHGRRLVQRSAWLLLERQLLEAADDIHFLTVSELLARLAGAPAAPALLRRRRRAYERESRLEAPRDLDLDAPAALAAGPSTLSGTGVSAGIAEGPVRLARAGEHPELRPGEVLVAPVLDAALGPLLLRAAGAVVEMGGMLSHGAVVARELGVPCVVDVRGAVSRLRDGQRVRVDGDSGRVEPLSEDATPAGPIESAELPVADPSDERLHALEPDALARESVYFNAHDPAAGVSLVTSLGVRHGGRGEAVLTLLTPDGRLLFGLDLEPARCAADRVCVGGLEAWWSPTRLRFRGRLASAQPAAFPPGPLALLLAPRVHEVDLDLSFQPTTPAVDLVAGIGPELRRALVPLGRHHVEQSGLFRGRLIVDGRALALAASGSRDHSWGPRDWSAADHWRLFIGRLGDGLAFHALSVSCRGRRVAGGFVWDGRRARALQRVEHAVELQEGCVTGFDLELVARDGGRFLLRGDVERRVTIPVQAERRPLALLARGPYALLLHEHFTRYRAGGRTGHGMAELTERPA